MGRASGLNRARQHEDCRGADGNRFLPDRGFELDKTEAVLRTEFGIDTRVYKPAAMVAFGYRADGPMFPKTRREIADITTWA